MGTADRKSPHVYVELIMLCGYLSDRITSPLTEPEELTPRKSKRLIEGFVSNGLLFDFVREEVHC